MNPRVAVTMGSDSDLPVMRGAMEALSEFGVPHEVRILSAHRTPDEMLAYGRSASGRGIKVIIAGAGGAAHLPGMLAAKTTVPVLGVPIASKHLNGQDSLLSIVQMPAGIPVATVSIGGARNAGLLAARILATSSDEQGAQIASRLAHFADDLRNQAYAKGEHVRGRTVEA